MTEHIIEIPFEKIRGNSDEFIKGLVEKLFPGDKEMSVEKLVMRQIYRVSVITQIEKVTP